MKFSSTIAFEKHIEKAMPDHLSDRYFIIDSDEYLQKKLADQLAFENEEIHKTDAEDLSPQKIDQLLNAYSMFSEQKCVIITRIDKLNKSMMKTLAKVLQSPLEKTRVVVTSSKKIIELKNFDKEGIVLDLSMEKPWDKEKRLSEYVVMQLRKERKKISFLLAEELVKKVGLSLSQIDSELEKILCYIKDRSEIVKEDLSLSKASIGYSTFKICDALLMGHKTQALKMIHLEKYPLMMLLYAMRSMVQKSLRLKELNYQAQQEAFPQLKGRMLEKSVALAQNYSTQVWKHFLKTLFDLEILFKNQSVNEEFMCSYLLLKIGEKIP